jgi:hypothetical protein
MGFAVNIVIGNIISLIAGIFIILSMWVNDEKQAYKYQFLNAFILIISSVFFLSWTGVTTMAIAAARNAMVYNDKLTFEWTIFFVVISVILGALVNTMGIIGFLPIIAIIQITICNYCLKSIKTIKLSFIVNSAIYVVYFLAIYDFSSAIIESFTALIGVISFAKLIHSTRGIKSS